MYVLKNETTGDIFVQIGDTILDEEDQPTKVILFNLSECEIVEKDVNRLIPYNSVEWD